jgi:hypothetical protein
VESEKLKTGDTAPAKQDKTPWQAVVEQFDCFLIDNNLLFSFSSV